jgi:hypothetical protein
MGPLQIYKEGKFELSEEDIFMLLSSIEPYCTSTESSILGPNYIGNEVVLTYNRCLPNPEANDERIKLMGTDCWFIISCDKEYEVILQSKIEIAKMVLDIEFEIIDEVNQLDHFLGVKAAYAIKEVFLK